MKVKHVLIGATLLTSSSVMAEFSSNIGATSNYVWRGVSQTMNSAAISGGLDYESESGFYAGTWVSNVDFGLDEGSGTEIDFYAGYYFEAGIIAYDVGVSTYMYPSPGFEDSNFTEAYGNVFVSDFTFGVAYTFQSDLEDASPFGKGDLYYSAGYTFELIEGLTTSLTYGIYNFDEDISVYGDNDYSHFLLDVSKGDFTFSVSKASEESGDDSTNFFVSYTKTF